ncbi:hypothetical protein GQ457_08G036040 [Hibiscus cannabinus]
MQIASLGEGKEARRIHLDLCSSTVFENYGSMIKQWGGVVYRSWTFGFDSDIPRVTISGRFCDWTGSRGLHLLVSEPGYAINGKPVNGETLPPPPPDIEIDSSLSSSSSLITSLLSMLVMTCTLVSDVGGLEMHLEAELHIIGKLIQSNWVVKVTWYTLDTM